MSIDIDFSRADLAATLEEVRKHGGDNRRVGITYTKMGCQKFYFFEYGCGRDPDYFTADVRAENAYDARAKGWREWLQSKGAK